MSPTLATLPTIPTLTKSGVAVSGGGPSSYLVLEEDGTSKLLLEEGTFFILLEESA